MELAFAAVNNAASVQAVAVAQVVNNAAWEPGAAAVDMVEVVEAAVAVDSAALTGPSAVAPGQPCNREPGSPARCCFVDVPGYPACSVPVKRDLIAVSHRLLL